MAGILINTQRKNHEAGNRPFLALRNEDNSFQEADRIAISEILDDKVSVCYENPDGDIREIIGFSGKVETLERKIVEADGKPIDFTSFDFSASEELFVQEFLGGEPVGEPFPLKDFTEELKKSFKQPVTQDSEPDLDLEEDEERGEDKEDDMADNINDAFTTFTDEDGKSVPVALFDMNHQLISPSKAKKLIKEGYANESQFKYHSYTKMGKKVKMGSKTVIEFDPED